MSQIRPVVLPPQRQDNFNVWAMFCHLSVFLAVLIPFGFILGPLCVWLFKRHDSEEINHHGLESLNFQITILIYAVGTITVGFFLIFLNAVIGVMMMSLMVIALVVYDIVCIIILSIKAYQRIPYRYPLSIRLIKQ